MQYIIIHTYSYIHRFRKIPIAYINTLHTQMHKDCVLYIYIYINAFQKSFQQKSRKTNEVLRNAIQLSAFLSQNLSVSMPTTPAFHSWVRTCLDYSMPSLILSLLTHRYSRGKNSRNNKVWMALFHMHSGLTVIHSF